MTDKELEDLWRGLDDVPFNEDECIEEDYHIWEKGTDKLTIWHWFDKEHSKGLAEGIMHLND